MFELSGGSHGALQSPGFPDNYPRNQDCSWKFWLAAGSKFSMEFLTFDVESDPLCSFDYVELIEQNDEGLVTRSLLVHACHGSEMRFTIPFTHGSFEKLCGEQLPFTFNSSGRVVSIRLHTDYDVQESGFNTTYSTTDGKELNLHVKVVLFQHTNV